MSAPTSAAEDLLTCAGCGVHTTKAEVTDAGYHGPRCELELAHLDTAPNGTVRGVIGWLRAPGDVLEVEREQDQLAFYRRPRNDATVVG